MFEDTDIIVAERDHKLRQESAKTAAYREALSEVSGELYAAAFADTFIKHFERHHQGIVHGHMSSS